MVRISLPKPRSLLATVATPGSSAWRRTTLIVAIVVGFALLSQVSYDSRQMSILSSSPTSSSSSSVTSTRGGREAAVQQVQDQCRFFLAESAIPQSGLGIFTAMEIAKGEPTQAMSDICVYVADTPEGTDFETHSWASSVFLAQYEGRNPRGACEGVATLVNSMPDSVNTAELMPFQVQTNGGLKRTNSPGAGAISHYYGVSTRARRDVSAGSEITIDYGDWDYDKGKVYTAPTRTVEWLRKHGMCIDNIDIRTATDPEMGRGAFARRFLPQGALVAPAPLQFFPDRAVFQRQKPEALFVNYCFQPSGTNMLLFPYGPGINLINHSSKRPNVGLRWSTNPQSHTQWLDLQKEDLWKVVYPGALVVEVVAIRDIKPDEELFLDYGADWDAAWKRHVKKWKPNKEPYVYPADMDLTQPFRTVEEQKDKPYPKNLATVCFTENWDDIERNKPVKWSEPYWWTDYLGYCNILKRSKDKETEAYLYEVALGYRSNPPDLTDTRYVTKKVPQRAIMFADRPYQSDLHLKNGFRHPIGIPDDLVPEQWRDVAKSQ